MLWTNIAETLPEVHEEPYYVDDKSELHESDPVLVYYKCKDTGKSGYAVTKLILNIKDNSHVWDSPHTFLFNEKIPQDAISAWMSFHAYDMETE